ncbi:anthranilate/aminodeoxychorismate synthase component II [candidate division KSB3 bacterium]|uniref:Anthranilate/aminodeoxychorismate synthase component II n=1 Tax=candidate division KSB3 bacterium TaxID=2044937 RepID=A0A9D5JY81_9BACT|nr:anthranilate/aminodeoxychorismate synthase component II [candidate division KSB3 bacterium]MBD3326285.1 anthranilate/aminodeoxychorismate synthase component II [candidate division KSB3 bacterium]
MNILIIDNFDSFTYNLAQYFGELGANLQIFRNNAISVSEIRAHAPDGIVISPGPGTPDHAGITLSVIAELADAIPILGVCLGHQAIGQAFGGKVIRAAELMHGKTSQIYHDGTGIFEDLPSPLTATRYHSLVVDPESVPPCLRVTAHTRDGVIMGLSHTDLPVFGVQFHPESFLTTAGRPLLQNFLHHIAVRNTT